MYFNMAFFIKFKHLEIGGWHFPNFKIHPQLFVYRPRSNTDHYLVFVSVLYLSPKIDPGHSPRDYGTTRVDVGKVRQVTFINRVCNY